MQLHWIYEPERAPTNTEEKVYAEVIHAHPGYLVAAYYDCELDSALTEKEGRNRYRNVEMIGVRVKGEKDFVSEHFTAEHRAKFSRLAAWWDKARDKDAPITVALLPGMTPAELTELRELGLDDIQKLAKTDVPKNLEGWRELAKRFVSLSKPRMRFVDGQLKEVA